MFPCYFLPIFYLNVITYAQYDSLNKSEIQIDMVNLTNDRPLLTPAPFALSLLD